MTDGGRAGIGGRIWVETGLSAFQRSREEADPSRVSSELFKPLDAAN